METWVKKWLPDFQMLDYKVSYNNQKKFSQNNNNLKKGSPARVFTNVELSKINLPAEQGYVYCKLCAKYVFKESEHCDICQTCPSKVSLFIYIFLNNSL